MRDKAKETYQQDKRDAQVIEEIDPQEVLADLDEDL